MASSSSKRAQAAACDDQHHPNDSTTVEEETKETEPNHTKRRWSPMDDAKLLVHVVVHGTKMWSKLAQQLPGRSRRACRDRWASYLKPGLKDSPFSKQEELDLIVAHARYDKILTGRLCDSVQAHFHHLMAEKRSGKKANVNPRSSTFVCLACRFNWHPNVLIGERMFMADCRICRRVLAMGCNGVRGETIMASTRGNVRQSPPVVPSVSLELSLATTVSAPQQPPPAAASTSLPPPPPPPPSSPPAPAPPTFIDFLGVGSV